MGLFGRWRKDAAERARAAGRGLEATPVLDPAFGDPLLRDVIAQAGARDWPALRQSLRGAADQVEQTTLLAAAAEVGGVEEWAPQAVAAEPGDPLPLLLSGARQVMWAWEARTGARARNVTRDQWDVFLERLSVAEGQLLEVAEREPTWLAPWYFLQLSARGASLDKDVARYRFEAALRRAPGHPASHRQRLQQVCEKWGGSHAEMHAFARASMLEAAPGSPLGELVARAHLERWLDLGGGAQGRAYMSGPNVMAELQEAAQRSVFHPEYRAERTWRGVHNTFAMAFSLSGQRHLARPLFEALDGTVTQTPWAYLGGDPALSFRTHRARCAA
ncbi:hypothetical protein [Streptacidiphilus neutrinimicus]|uniref:hypothetical protein n=1 Tax=Streptacidiphilus neutrinimicus TaxID=105420 RepID=UPI001F1E8517|nr:hypothetical protein [Streptacidiphilus neutrinimicus]